MVDLVLHEARTEPLELADAGPPFEVLTLDPDEVGTVDSDRDGVEAQAGLDEGMACLRCVEDAGIDQHLNRVLDVDAKHEQPPQEPDLRGCETSTRRLAQALGHARDLATQQIVCSTNRLGPHVEHRITPLPNPLVGHSLRIASGDCSRRLRSPPS